jgi:hypothetical protein
MFLDGAFLSMKFQEEIVFSAMKPIRVINIFTRLFLLPVFHKPLKTRFVESREVGFVLFTS